ncbi:hypothetical protein [Streptomyces longwoodensis]|uniref:hypothetical protein n=1 Tax=Streptomyces longwoodensis TaxID=68231 RepID=UPI00340230FB
MSVDWSGWPLLHIGVAGLSHGDARALVAQTLDEALRRGEPFGAVMEMPPGVPQNENPDGRLQQVRAVRRLRPGLTERCRGLAFVLRPEQREQHAKVMLSGDKVWGCPTFPADSTEAARDWLRDRLAQGAL